MTRPIAASLLLAGLSLSAACGKPAAVSRPNLLLITLDTTRRDRLGAYGSGAGLTPSLDRLAREGLVAENAVAPVPLTLPSHATILTGLEPPRHGVRGNDDYVLPATETTLAEHLRSLGYGTYAVVASSVLASSQGLSQGFDRYDEPPPPGDAKTNEGGYAAHNRQRAAAEVTDAALAFVRDAGTRPFFLWAHYYDAHAPYRPPEPWSARYAAAPYDGEIAYMDSEIGRLLDALREGGALDRTLVVVVADHGEGLGEHGESTHGLFVYDTTIHVPEIVRLPGSVPAGSRYTGIVGHADLAPTILDLLGLAPLPGAAGIDLADAFRGGKPPEHPPAYAESLYGEHAYGWAPLHALRTAKSKFIEAPTPEWFDLAADPGELRNLAATERDRVADARRDLVARVEGMGTPGEAEAPASEERREQLASLGYVGGAKPREGGSAPDPKSLVDVHEELKEVFQMIDRGELDRAQELVAHALRRDPGNPSALTFEGRIALARGEAAHAVDRLEDAARLLPGRFEPQWNLGTALYRQGKYDEAIAAYGKAAAMRPDDPEVRQALGDAWTAKGSFSTAADAYREALRLGRNVADLHAALGNALDRKGDREGARAEFRKAVELQPGLGAAWSRLGVIEERSGNRDEAVRLYRKAIEADPSLADGWFNLGKALLLEGSYPEAKSAIDTLLENHPDYSAGWYTRGAIALASGDRALARNAFETFVGRKDADPRLVADARQRLRGMAP